MEGNMPHKRAAEDADAAPAPAQESTSPTAEAHSTKRARRTRWTNDDARGGSDASASDAPTRTTPTAAASKAALSEIVKKLSSVVQEKSTPGAAPIGVRPDAMAKAAAVAAAINAQPTSMDAITAAKARAIAQASLLSMSLPVTQVSQSDLALRVYVGNLSYDLMEDDIRNWFSPFGTLRSIDLSMEPGAARSKGFCFLEYDDVLAAESAVQVLNGTQFSNRVVRVGRPLRGNAPDSQTALNVGREAIKHVTTKCLYVAGVRMELNSHHLESIFSPFGTITACVMTAISPLEVGMHRGYGFLEFADEASASNAIQHMNGFELAGQKLKVGKASSSALLINLAISKDKVVHAGHAHAGFMDEATQQSRKKAVVEDADVDGVQDVEEPEREKEARRCLCLMNLVQLGEVDDELEDEVRNECATYGPLQTVEIRELADHVRVFVLFQNASDALRARGALHGRFFGGNKVAAEFYPPSALLAQRYTSAFL